MSIRSQTEFEKLRAIGRIVRQALDETAAAVRPGITTRELDEIGARVLGRNGAESTPPNVYGFPGALCISVNEEAIHGIPVYEIGRVVERETRRSGFRVIRDLCGHGVGRTIHEPPSIPNYREPRLRTRLTEGLVITIEPIISAGNGQGALQPDRWTVCTADSSLAAHYEHTVVITKREPILLTAA